MAEPHDASPANDAPPLEAAVREALKDVIDPELGQNIIDLGLVYGIDVSDRGQVDIVMTLTTPGCPAAHYIEKGVYERVWSVPGVKGVEVSLVWYPRWTPELMSDEVKRRLGFA